MHDTDKNNGMHSNMNWTLDWVLGVGWGGVVESIGEVSELGPAFINCIKIIKTTYRLNNFFITFDLQLSKLERKRQRQRLID